MNGVERDIFRAIHENKWMHIRYKNISDEITNYWIGIKDVDPVKRTLSVDGLHLVRHTVMAMERIFIDSILSSDIVDGSFHQTDDRLIKDIHDNPEKYSRLFDNIPNLKILNYLENCFKLDNVPYKKDFELIQALDIDQFINGEYCLNDEQFATIIRAFCKNNSNKNLPSNNLKLQKLAFNMLSLNTRHGLYVLAYKELRLDVCKKCLVLDDEINISSEFTLDGTIFSIRLFLDADEYELLNDYDTNAERIKDILSADKRISHVDDMPYIIGLGTDVIVDLHTEYLHIHQLYENGSQNAPVPIRAFFGDLLKRPISRKTYPIVTMDDKVNLDQLLVIHNAMKYPLTYVQGPPGTGKTSTIVNLILTAVFNDRSVLLCAYNNHPLDGVFDKLISLKYENHIIPFPVLRLGNKEKDLQAISYIKQLITDIKDIRIYESTLEKKKALRQQKSTELSKMLQKYEEHLGWQERRDAIEDISEFEKNNMTSLNLVRFQSNLSTTQIKQVQKKIDNTAILPESALSLLDNDYDGLYLYLYYSSAARLKKLLDNKFDKLRNILDEQDDDKKLKAFRAYLKDSDSLHALQSVFPVIISTCISSINLGNPGSHFDMVVMDEASQCNTAIALIPILRGERLVLVGDPQQLNPVIVMDEITNSALRKKYNIDNAYDYRQNSIYKTYLACDIVSDEILLHDHYRCAEKIISFNNKKYYNSKLRILTNNKSDTPLTGIDVKDPVPHERNTSPAQARIILDFIRQNPDKSIAVITPFVNQKKLISEQLASQGINNVPCGTVHAFQGDERDVIIFSTAITHTTSQGTYDWIKNNRELINVATSRAREKFMVLTDIDEVRRLHGTDDKDDFYELIEYVRSNGETIITPKETLSRALGIKPYSSETEAAFLITLNHALANVIMSQGRYIVRKEVAISQVFEDNTTQTDLFYTGRFDFVVYEHISESIELPVLAFELDGKEHYDDEQVQRRDNKKKQIAEDHGLTLIHVDNSYARRYNHIKAILESYFKKL